MLKISKKILAALLTCLVCILLIFIFLVYHQPLKTEKLNLNLNNSNLELIEKGKLKVATSSKYPPFEYTDTEQLKGFDIDIAKQIAKDLNLEIEFIDISFDLIVNAIENHQADIAISGLAITSERLQKINFSDIYYTDSSCIVVKKNSKINSSNINELIHSSSNLTSISQTGSTCNQYATTHFPNLNNLDNPDTEECVKILNQNKASLLFVNKAYAESKFTSKNTIFYADGFNIISELSTKEDYAIGINKTNTNLHNVINQIIKQRKEDGTIEKIQNSNL